MNLPFSLLDILERLMPGGIFLGILVLLPPDFLLIYNAAQSVKTGDVFLASMFISLSYALGVCFNLIAGIWPWHEKAILKRHASKPSDSSRASLSRLQEVFKEVFEVEFNNDSWRLCYGIADKSGYGIRIDLFSSLNTFCRSMYVGMLIISMLYIIETIFDFTLTSISTSILAAISCGIFAYGANTYSKVFTAAVYESFLTWYAVERAKSSSATAP